MSRVPSSPEEEPAPDPQAARAARVPVVTATVSRARARRGRRRVNMGMILIIMSGVVKPWTRERTNPACRTKQPSDQDIPLEGDNVRRAVTHPGNTSTDTAGTALTKEFNLRSSLEHTPRTSRTHRGNLRTPRESRTTIPGKSVGEPSVTPRITPLTLPKSENGADAERKRRRRYPTASGSGTPPTPTGDHRPQPERLDVPHIPGLRRSVGGRDPAPPRSAVHDDRPRPPRWPSVGACPGYRRIPRASWPLAAERPR
jgi:hypothetical protein